MCDSFSSRSFRITMQIPEKGCSTEKIQGDNLAKGTSYFQLLCVIDTRFHQNVLLNMQMFLKGECPFNDLKVLE